MKKLMFAMAALAAGVTLADVTSQNIVGYQTKEMTKGKNFMVGIQFNNIGGQNVQLSDIVVFRADKSTASDRYGDGLTLLWTYDSAKSKYSSKLKYWANPYTDSTKTERVGAPAWGDENMVVTNMTFKPGDGVWIKPGIGTNSYKPTLTIAGEVVNPGTDAQYYTWELTKGKNFHVANPFPASVDLQDVVVYRADKSTASDMYGDGLTLFWIYDSAKSKYSSKLKYWINPYTDGTKSARVGFPAWGDENMIVTNLTIEASQGFWIKPGIGTNSNKPLIRFNNPFYSGAAE